MRKLHNNSLADYKFKVRNKIFGINRFYKDSDLSISYKYFLRALKISVIFMLTEKENILAIELVKLLHVRLVKYIIYYNGCS